MATDDERPDPTVKQLLEGRSLDDVVDAATQRELERWFGLPSFEQLAAQPKPPEDPEMVAVRERREKALAAVDPALVERIRVRTETTAESLLKFEPTIDIHVDPSVALLDVAMIERAIAEPREVEIPEQLRDDLKDVTPQALLRDLHRPALDFEKTFEVVDMAAEQRFDIVAEVETVMATSWKLPPLGASPLVESRRMLDELRADRKKSWVDAIKQLPLPNRRHAE